MRINSCRAESVGRLKSSVNQQCRVNSRCEELSMVASNVALVPADLPQEKHEIGDHGPMSQQGAADSHGHDMHPQKFVRLVGCHESHPASHASAHRLH
jgi:hypothetical protein